MDHVAGDPQGAQAASMSMTFKLSQPIKPHHDTVVMYAYADPYDAGDARKPDAMIVRVGGVYKCALGPNWCAPFVAEAHDAETAKIAIARAFAAREAAETRAKK